MFKGSAALELGDNETSAERRSSGLDSGVGVRGGGGQVPERSADLGGVGVNGRRAAGEAAGEVADEPEVVQLIDVVRGAIAKAGYMELFIDEGDGVWEIQDSYINDYADELSGMLFDIVTREEAAQRVIEYGRSGKISPDSQRTLGFLRRCVQQLVQDRIKTLRKPRSLAQQCFESKGKILEGTLGQCNKKHCFITVGGKPHYVSLQRGQAEWLQNYSRNIRIQLTGQFSEEYQCPVAELLNLV